MVRITDVDDLIRHVLFKNSLPTTPLSISLHNSVVYVGEHIFEIAPGVIACAIEEEWLVHTHPHPSVEGGLYQFNYERAEEWQEAEEARVREATAALQAQGIRARHTQRCAELQHPGHMDNQTRGFLFVDDKRNEYLVTLRGRVVPVLKHITI
jgi:hypothetical protein